MKKSFLFLGLTFGWAALTAPAVVDIANSPTPETRLRLGDRTQELRTTSVNWPDLVKGGRPQRALSPPRRALRVMLDAGHGGKDLGAAPRTAPLVEKDLTLRISENVKRALERYSRLNDVPIEVRMSREDDSFIGLRERVRLANEWPADLFVSIHANSSNYVRARGFEVYFINVDEPSARTPRVASLDNTGLSPSVANILRDAEQTVHVNESSSFAEYIFQAMSFNVRPHRRGVHQAPFTVLHGTQMPAVLIEVGYLTNKDDVEKLSKAPYLKRLSNAISAGIVEFAAHRRKNG